MVTGFLVLAAAGVMLAAGAQQNNYLWMLPGLLVFGTGLAIVLTVNDPVSVDSVPDRDQGQASGVSATAEQGGGALGIAVLYALFHQVYLAKLQADMRRPAGLPSTRTPSRSSRTSSSRPSRPGCGLPISARTSSNICCPRGRRPTSATL